MKRKFCTFVFLLSLSAALTISAAASDADVLKARPSRPAFAASADTAQSSAQTTASSSTVSSYAREVCALVNVERAKYGLDALTLDATLCSCAQRKSQDMHDLGYFSHTSPTYGTPFEMMRLLGVTYAHAGENIAMGYSSPQAVVDAWMHSSSHRAIILSASYRTTGVGYVADGGYWTQWFIG